MEEPTLDGPLGEQQQIPLRAIVPNLVTSMAACAGITSISLSSEGRFEHALVAILIACVCDGMDGRVARLLNASSRLGAELDSLADFVNFGVAPAMFMYFWMTGGPMHVLGGATVPTPLIRIVLGCSLYYALCDCFRLARFKAQYERGAALVEIIMKDAILNIRGLSGLNEAVNQRRPDLFHGAFPISRTRKPGVP